MIVTYVPPSNDAAIAGTYKDIKVTNPYDTPIYVEGGTSGRTLTFTIYGKETRPANRTVKYKSETLSVRDPGEPITQVDPSLAPGARIRVQSAHRGLKSRLWKCVYIDGVETERILLHTDTYNASKAIYKVGPEAPPPQQTEPAPPQNTGESSRPLRQRRWRESEEVRESQGRLSRPSRLRLRVRGQQAPEKAAPEYRVDQLGRERYDRA